MYIALIFLSIRCTETSMKSVHTIYTIPRLSGLEGANINSELCS